MQKKHSELPDIQKKLHLEINCNPYNSDQWPRESLQQDRDTNQWRGKQETDISQDVSSAWEQRDWGGVLVLHWS